MKNRIGIRSTSPIYNPNVGQAPAMIAVSSKDVVHPAIHRPKHINTRLGRDSILAGGGSTAGNVDLLGILDPGSKSP